MATDNFIARILVAARPNVAGSYDERMSRLPWNLGDGPVAFKPLLDRTPVV
jgi:hypothetical protein